MNHPLNRRAFLKSLGLSGVAIVTSGILRSGIAQALEACDKTDAKAPAAMMVKALKYVPVSKTKGQKCENCIQYKAETGKKIGQCNILQGCSVAAAGWCASWSIKA